MAPAVWPRTGQAICSASSRLSCPVTGDPGQLSDFVDKIIRVGPGPASATGVPVDTASTYGHFSLRQIAHAVRLTNYPSRAVRAVGAAAVRRGTTHVWAGQGRNIPSMCLWRTLAVRSGASARLTLIMPRFLLERVRRSCRVRETAASSAPGSRSAVSAARAIWLCSNSYAVRAGRRRLGRPAIVQHVWQPT